MKSIAVLPLILVFITAGKSVAHEGHHHGPHTQEAKQAEASADTKLAYESIQTEYLKTVAPIFEEKCAACHSASSQSPWYSHVLGLHQLIESDRAEAKVHFEISKGFPFGGHGELIEDLKAINEDIVKDTMPTRFYALMHPSSKLTDSEKTQILAWVDGSLEKLASLSMKEPHQ